MFGKSQCVYVCVCVVWMVACIATALLWRLRAAEFEFKKSFCTPPEVLDIDASQSCIIRLELRAVSHSTEFRSVRATDGAATYA